MAKGSIKFANEDEVYEHYLEDKENRQVIIFEGVVYDVKEYAPNHPGGADYITDLLGKNIEEEFEENEHTKSARKTFQELPVIGTVGKNDDSASTSSQGSNTGEKEKFGAASSLYGIKFNESVNTRLNFDYSKSLFTQIYNADFSYEEYITYINEPKQFVNPVKDLILFDNAFLEAVSQAPFWHVPAAFGPWALYCLYMITQVNFTSNPLAILLVTFIGALGWTLMEYMFHRFIFHGEDYWMQHVPQSKYLYTVHFFGHGIHHAFPQDRYRIVFPPVPGILLVFYPFLWLPSINVIPQEYSYNLWFGFLIGYIIYEMTHYTLHHCSPKDGYFKYLKLYHMQHHYKFGTVGFGVSSKFWDLIFRTEINMESKTRKNK